MVYAIALFLTVLVLLGTTALAMFKGFELIWALELPKQIATAVSADTYGALHKTVAKLFEVVQLLVVSILALLAGLAAFKLIELPARGHGGFAQGTRYMTARFYDHRVWMLGVGWFSLLVTILLFGQLPPQFQPTIDSENTRIEVEMVPGTTLAEAKKVVNGVAARVRQEPDVERVLERIRLGESSSIFVKLKDDRSRKSYDFERDLAPELAQIPDARVRFQSQRGGFGSGRDITIMLAGSDPVLLEQTAATLVEQMKGLNTIVAPRISADINRPEIIITPRAKIAAELGVTTAALSQTIRIATLGEIEQNAARFSLSDRQIPIKVRLSTEARTDFRTIENLPVPTLNGGSVPLGRVAEIKFGSGRRRAEGRGAGPDRWPTDPQETARRGDPRCGGRGQVAAGTGR
jgi:multidrug efflux pump subunit AcrB